MKHVYSALLKVEVLRTIPEHSYWKDNPFKCDSCGFFAGNLDRHTRTHDEEKPLQVAMLGVDI